MLGSHFQLSMVSITHDQSKNIEWTIPEINSKVLNIYYSIFHNYPYLLLIFVVIVPNFVN
jgi:hypothetical protein